MEFLSWLYRLHSRLLSSPRRRPAASRSKLHFEQLETRETPSAAVGVYALLPAFGSGQDTNIPPAILGNPNVDGIALRAQWDALEPSEGAYDWITNPSTNYFDTQIAKAAATNKKVSLSITAGIHTPSWVFRDGARAFASTSSQPAPLPWDPIFEAKWHDFITALGNHFAGNPTVVQVKITGVNNVGAETALPDSPSDVNHGYTTANVESAFATMAGYFAAAFPTQQLAAMVRPAAFPTVGGSDTINGQLIDNAANTYGGRFVAQNNALSDYFTYSVVTSRSTQVPTGYQMLWSVTFDTTYRMYYTAAQITQNPMPTPPLSLDQILLEAVDKGVSNNAKFLEIYSEDITATSPAALPGVIANAHTRLDAHFRVSMPATVTAGSSFSVTVTAVDANNNPLTNYQDVGYPDTSHRQTLPGYIGKVHFTSSDGQALVPADYTFAPSDNGTQTFSVTLQTAGSQSLTVTDLQAGVISGSVTAGVNPAAANSLSISSLATLTAGSPANFLVSAYDRYGNIATGYQSTVHFTSSDLAAVLPANYTFTAADAGQHTFSVTLKTAGSQWVTATDMANLTATMSVGVVPAAVDHFVLLAPASGTAGSALTVTVVAQDAFHNQATGYRGTVTWSSSDTQAVLPASYTFTAGDNGSHVFSATLRTAGSQWLKATDTASISGSTSVTVNPAATMQLLVTSNLTRITAGSGIQVTVRAVDAYGNTSPAYAGTVHFTSTDAQAGLPRNYQFTATDLGVHKFTVYLRTAGSQTVTATDTTTPGLTGTTAAITVQAGYFNHFLLIAPASVSVGTPFSVTVKAVDSFGNLVTTFAGAIQFSSSDTAATLPPNYQFVSTDHGVHTFTVTFRTKGTQTLHIAWLSHPQIGSSDNILVQ